VLVLCLVNVRQLLLRDEAKGGPEPASQDKNK
jgi:hypothetical protein